MGNCLEYFHLFQGNRQLELPPQHPQDNPNLITQGIENRDSNKENQSKIRNIQSSKGTNFEKQANPSSNLYSFRPLMDDAVSSQNKENAQKNRIIETNAQRNTLVATKSTNQQKYPKQLQASRQQFLKSHRFNHVLTQSNDVQNMLQVAAEAHSLHLFSQQKNIYLRTLTKVQPLKNHFSRESIQETKAQIYSQLTNIAIIQNNEVQGGTFFLRAMQAYKHSSLVSTIQQKVTLLNNYAVFKWNRGKLQDAKRHLLQAIHLMQSYCAVNDDRKYLSFVNLECLYYESLHPEQAKNVLEKIKKQCKNKEIVALAEQNARYYDHKAH